MDGFSYSLRLIPIHFPRSSRSHRTKATAPRTDISEYHESSRTGTPTFTHIGTIATLANCMKLVRIYQSADMFVILTNRKFYPEPVRFFYSKLSLNNTGNNRKLCHWTKVRKGVRSPKTEVRRRVLLSKDVCFSTVKKCFKPITAIEITSDPGPPTSVFPIFVFQTAWRYRPGRRVVFLFAQT